MEPALSPIISPPLDCLSFEAGGVTYTRTDTLALSRARILQRFQTEMLFDVTLKGLAETVAATRAELNAGKWADGLYKFGQLVEKVNLIGANRVRQAEIVGLFYNAPDEDPTTYQFAAQQAKVYEAWGAVDGDFFIAAAYGLLLRSPTHYPPALAPLPLHP